MRHYVGIDLGTTNSAICTYDGQKTRIWKSPEQNDVTPSAIYIDKRGNRYFGQKAYNQAPYSPNDSAVLFKRFMGTNTKIEIASANISLTPQECSAEIIKVLSGYLPEEIRDSEDTAVIITVPAAFNQMKKDATLHAASLAGLSNVALMQEPVAAIMSVMATNQQEGLFMIYDLGGGTFDVSIAENIGGKVNLLTHGGVEMCGGRDFDRAIFNRIVLPWLCASFSLPDDFTINPKYKSLCRLAQWAAEKAKIELSSRENSVIALSEIETRTADLDGNEVYLDIPLQRSDMDLIIGDVIDETIEASHTILSKSGLSPNDINRVVFIGGPSSYKPLRDKVTRKLGIPSDIDVNPMTAVAEGASIFAESIDWKTKSHDRKANSSQKYWNKDVTFKYISRTSDTSAKVACNISENINGWFAQFFCTNTGWTSGRTPLKNNLIIALPLHEDGDNTFTVEVFDEYGKQQSIDHNKIIITKTLATIGAIPSSHSIGVEAMDKLGGSSVLSFLIREGDTLPKRGKTTFKAAQTIRAGTPDALNIKLWEGSIEDPITDNRFIGVLKILGTDFSFGIIPTGAEIICDYEMSDSGNIRLEVAVPCIGASFNNKNFYSRQEGETANCNADQIANEGRLLIVRINVLSAKVQDDRLFKAREKAQRAAGLGANPNQDTEEIQKANNGLLEAKKLISEVRQEHLSLIRQIDLDACISRYESTVKNHGKLPEQQAFDSLHTAAQRAIDLNDTNFEGLLKALEDKGFTILWRQDWYVVQLYSQLIATPYRFSDIKQFNALKSSGDLSLGNGDINGLRITIHRLADILIPTASGKGMFDMANIVAR